MTSILTKNVPTNQPLSCNHSDTWGGVRFSSQTILRLPSGSIVYLVTTIVYLIGILNLSVYLLLASSSPTVLNPFGSFSIFLHKKTSLFGRLSLFLNLKVKLHEDSSLLGSNNYNINCDSWRIHINFSYLINASLFCQNNKSLLYQTTSSRLNRLYLSSYDMIIPPMLEKIKKLLGHAYTPLNRITVSRQAILQNYRFLSSANKKIKIAPVLKSNAYGHGIIQIAKLIDPLHPPFFCVDSLYEGYELLKSQIKTPILIMGYVNPRNLQVKKLPFSYAVYDMNLVKMINQYQSHVGIHIFVDTGMHREGIKIEDLTSVIKQLQSFSNIRIEGLMSHFAAPDDTQNKLTQRQVQTFAHAQHILKELGVYPQWIHMAASSGLLNSKAYKNIGNMARTGKSLYGITSDTKTNLSPALQLTTTLAQIKTLKEGESVGYDFTFTADKDMVIGILPIGYNDGVDRRLSNKGVVLIDNTYCPIIGRVSMNITTIDLSKVRNPYVNQEVIVFSGNPLNKNSIVNAAKTCNTLPHDLLVHLSESIKRELI